MHAMHVFGPSFNRKLCADMVILHKYDSNTSESHYSFSSFADIENCVCASKAFIKKNQRKPPLEGLATTTNPSHWEGSFVARDGSSVPNTV